MSLSNGLELDHKQVGEDSSYKMIHDNRRNGDYGGLKEVGIGLGVKPHLGNGELNLLGFYYDSELSNADATWLKNNVTGYTSNDDDQKRYGANLKYKLGYFTLLGQYIKGEDGVLDRDGWFIQPSYKLKRDRERFDALEFLVRYGELDVDIAKVTADSETWDRKELPPALIIDIAKNIKLKTEYYIFDEDTGDGGVIMMSS